MKNIKVENIKGMYMVSVDSKVCVCDGANTYLAPVILPRHSLRGRKVFSL